MALPGRKFTFKPSGYSDTLDATNSPPGSMASLQNLIPSPQMKNAFTCRPASEKVVDFTTSDLFDSPAQITALFVLGTRAYGMIASSNYADKDMPFCYDFSVNAFVEISGLSAVLLPATQSTTGDWTPPTVAMIGQRIIFTHPGFAGGPDPYFGWIDVSGFSLTSLVGNVTNGSNVIQSISGDGTSNPIIDGVQPGQTLSAGALFPAGTYVLSVEDGTFDLDTTGTTNGTTTVSAVADLTGIEVGMYVSGINIVAGTYVAALPGGGDVTLSTAATGSTSGGAINFSGGGSITVSQAATGATTNLQALTIAGGTTAAPLWGAGNMNVYPLVGVPVAVANFNGRAYYAVNNTAVFSDPLMPCNATNANQALTLGDDDSITALVGLPLANLVTGGVQQALIAYKGLEILYQITGDAATSNLAQNAINGSVGTLAPNSITSTPLGLAFVAENGIRILNLVAQTTEPIGAYGEGASVPFENAIFPTRMAACFNQNVLRVSVQNGSLSGEPYQEYWYDFSLKRWSGPHTFPASLIQPYHSAGGNSEGYAFLAAAAGVNASLWASGTFPTLDSGYTENGVPLTFNYATSLLPDNQDMAMNAVVETSIAMNLSGGQSVTVIATDDNGNQLDSVVLSSPGTTATIWGAFTWGAAPWGSLGPGYFKQYQVPWHVPLVFKQASLSISGFSSAGFVIGNQYIRLQELDYFIQPGSVSSGTVVPVAGIVVNGSTQISSNIVTYIVEAAAVTTQILPALPNLWEVHTIKDGAGNASEFPITINGNGKEIDGESEYVLNFNYQSVTLQWDGSEWAVI